MSGFKHRTLHQNSNSQSSGSTERECLQCGMLLTVEAVDFKDQSLAQHCIKCDAELLSQTDHSILTVDIAHRRETLDQAIDKMDIALQQAWQGYTQAIRFIVGGGRIREQVQGQLQYYCDQGYVLQVEEEAFNRGAILVNLRQ